jgi:hypothetical protein
MNNQPTSEYHTLEITLHTSLKQARAVQNYVSKALKLLETKQKIQPTDLDLILGFANLSAMLEHEVIPQLETLEAVSA